MEGFGSPLINVYKMIVEKVELTCLTCNTKWIGNKKPNYRDIRCPNCKCRHKLVNDIKEIENEFKIP